jgi:hypothetical protein
MRLLLTIGVATLATLWVAPWLVLVGGWAAPGQGRPLLSAPSTFALLAGGALVTHFVGRWAIRRGALRWALALFGALVVLVAVRFDQYPNAVGWGWLGELAHALQSLVSDFTPPALAVAVGVVLWWSGVRLGRQLATHDDVEQGFRWGVGGLIGAALAAALTARSIGTGHEALGPAAVVFPVLFFCLGLVLLGIGRLEAVQPTEQSLGVHGQWLAVLILMAGGTVLIALVAAQAASFDVLLVLAQPIFAVLGVVLIGVLYVVLIPLAFLIQLVVYLVLQLLHPGDRQEPPAPPQTDDIDAMLRQLINWSVPNEVLEGAKAAAAVVLVGGVLVLAARAVARWRPASSAADVADEERETLMSGREVFGLLLARLWGWVRRVLLRRPARLSEGPLAASAEDASGPAAAGAQSVRGLYAALLALGAGAGAERPAPATAREHASALRAVLRPETTVDRLTGAYETVRYAEQPVPAAEIEHLAADLASVVIRRDPG